MKNLLAVLGALLFVAVTVFFISDFSAADHESITTTIDAKIYIGPYVTHHIGHHVYKVGKTTVSVPYPYTIHHPAQFRVTADATHEAYNVDEKTFDNAVEGEPITLSRRVGRWTKWRYSWSLIELNPKLEK